MGIVVSYLNGRGFVRDLNDEFRSYGFTSGDVIDGSDLEIGDLVTFEGTREFAGPCARHIRKLPEYGRAA